MQTLKFRGRDAYGKYRYGDLWQRNDGTVIYDAHVWHRVKPDSVAQFVGYDTNGKEIYEGDTLIDEKGFTYTAFLQPSVEWEKEKEMKDFFGWHGAPLAVAEQFAKLKLKVSELRDVD